MKKIPISYSDLSRKQIQYLKEHFIQKKVNDMSQKDLKDFVLDIISHQINDTIGKEEEMEAWREMSDYFGDEFETIMLEIKTKYNDNELKETEEDSQKERIHLLEKNNLEKHKTDMWDD